MNKPHVALSSSDDTDNATHGAAEQPLRQPTRERPGERLERRAGYLLAEMKLPPATRRGQPMPAAHPPREHREGTGRDQPRRHSQRPSR
jgi:hypothetical protein